MLYSDRVEDIYTVGYIFTIMTYMATLNIMTPALGSRKYNFGRPFLGHHFFILNLSDLCLGVEKKIFIGIMHFRDMT